MRSSFPLNVYSHSAARTALQDFRFLDFQKFLFLVPCHGKKCQGRHPWVDTRALLVRYSSSPGHGLFFPAIPTPPPDGTVCYQGTTVLPTRCNHTVHSSAGASHSLWRTGIRQWIHIMGCAAFSASGSSGRFDRYRENDYPYGCWPFHTLCVSRSCGFA